MTWGAGQVRVADLLAAGELDNVVADDSVARRLLDDAGRHLETATVAAGNGDLNGAYQLAYDAMRKSAASLLAAQGLRATSRGGHVAVQEAVKAQFDASVQAFRPFGRLRRSRNNFEYPDADTAGASSDDVDDAIVAARGAHRAATTILDQGILTPWR